MADDMIKIAVASDLHAYTSADNSPSHLKVGMSELPHENPIAGLVELIEQKGLTATALLCPGDLGHQADVQGIPYAWQQLKRVADKLGATLCTATAGNHDMDSRYLGDDHAPDHILKDLSPPFPLDDPQLNDRYWARSYALKDLDDFRLVLLNSSAYHGNRPNERDYGRIDKYALRELEKELQGSARREINILLCHHHPHPHSEIGLGEQDVMRQGQLLLDLLGSGKYGQWLVIHGHKHHPKISYAAGGAASPVVFAAGSLSSTLFTQLQTVTRNQFYIIEISSTECLERGLVGRIKSWDWSVGRGWIDSDRTQQVSAEFGFGCREAPTVLAKRIAREVFDDAQAYLDWNDFLEKVPAIRYLLPQDFYQVEQELNRVGIEVLRSGIKPAQIGRKQSK